MAYAALQPANRETASLVVTITTAEAANELRARQLAALAALVRRAKELKQQ